MCATRLLRPHLFVAGLRKLVQWRVEETEPARQVRLDRELLLELRLQPQLRGVVALLALAGRHERPERAALEPVDQVRRVLAALEGEERREQLLAEAPVRELSGDEVHGRDQVLEVAVAHDEPLVAVRVVAPPDLGAGALSDDGEELVDLLLGPGELPRRERLGHDSRHAGGLEPELGLERDLRGREREKLVELRALEALPPAEEDVR